MKERSLVAAILGLGVATPIVAVFSTRRVGASRDPRKHLALPGQVGEDLMAAVHDPKSDPT